jgi:hypothetical protein
MFQSEALSLSDLERIQYSENPSKAASELLNTILEPQENALSICDCFLEALKNTDQGHIFLWISDPGKLN